MTIEECHMDGVTKIALVLCNILELNSFMKCILRKTAGAAVRTLTVQEIKKLAGDGQFAAWSAASDSDLQVFKSKLTQLGKDKEKWADIELAQSVRAAVLRMNVSLRHRDLVYSNFNAHNSSAKQDTNLGTNNWHRWVGRAWFGRGFVVQHRAGKPYYR